MTRRGAVVLTGIVGASIFGRLLLEALGTKEWMAVFGGVAAAFAWGALLNLLDTAS